MLTPAAVVGPLIGVVLWLVVRAAASGRIARNGAVGIRTAATQASDAAWEAGHAAAVRPALVGACLMTAASVPAWLSVGREPVQVGCAIAIAALLVAEAVVVVVLSTRAARRATGGG